MSIVVVVVVVVAEAVVVVQTPCKGVVCSNRVRFQERSESAITCARQSVNPLHIGVGRMGSGCGYLMGVLWACVWYGEGSV